MPDRLTVTPHVDAKRRWVDWAGDLAVAPIISGIAPAMGDGSTEWTAVGGPNGIRTRVSALRGPCPRPLDDGAARLPCYARLRPTPDAGSEKWLGEEGSNPHYQGQNLASYH